MQEVTEDVISKAKSIVRGNMRSNIQYGHSKPITEMQWVEHLI